MTTLTGAAKRLLAIVLIAACGLILLKLVVGAIAGFLQMAVSILLLGLFAAAAIWTGRRVGRGR
jgi:type IV secretory pathway VirB2 component (pilin)